MFNSVVRVVILNYNQHKFTIDCVNSVLQQSYKFLQIVVVDNNSEYNDFRKLKELLPEKVILIRSNLNLGYAKGNNLGCNFKAQEKAEFILILNNDTELNDKYTLTKLLTSFSQKGDSCAIVAPLINTISSGDNPYVQIQGRKLLNTLRLIVANSAVLSKLPIGKKVFNEYIYSNLIPYKTRSVYEVDCVSGACFLFNTKYLENGNLFDENTFLYFEEIILGQQLKNLNLKSYINTDTCILHYHGASTGKRGKIEPFSMFRHSLKSELYFYKTYRNLNFINSFLFQGLKYFEYFLKRTVYLFI